MAAAPYSFPYFGRAWKLDVTTSDGTDITLSSSDFKEALRVTFRTNMALMLAFPTATITVYNPSSQTQKQVMQGTPNAAATANWTKPLVLGNTVKLSAGYQDPGPTLIWEGKVLQSIWMRENVVDYKLTLRCIIGLFEDSLNTVNVPIPKKTCTLDTLKQVCQEAATPIPIASMDAVAEQKLSRTVFPKSQAWSSRPYEAIDLLLKQDSLFKWVSKDGLNVRSFESVSQTPKYIYAPPDPIGVPAPSAPSGTIKTILGTPEQTQDGVLFRVLMDPRPMIGDVVQLVNTVINPVEVQYMKSRPPYPSTDGVYVVAGMQNVGDTRGRGDDWYTEIHGQTFDFFGKWSAVHTAS